MAIHIEHACSASWDFRGRTAAKTFGASATLPTNLPELRRRDTKGLYRRAGLADDAPGKLTCLSGVNDPFEAPSEPDLYFNTGDSSIAQCTARLCEYVLDQTVFLKRRRVRHGQ